MSTYRAEEKEAAEVVNRMRILHVYGQIGRLPWQRAEGFLNGLSGREYGTPINPDDPSAGLEIKVISEVQRDDARFETARTWMLQAKHIHFLGFAYHPENLDRLRLEPDPTWPGRGQIAGTCLGLSERRRYDLVNTGAEFGIPINLDPRQPDVETYFAEVVEG